MLVRGDVSLTGSSVADASSLFVPGVGYNGATYDRWRNNNEGTLLASAARTTIVSSAQTKNYNARSIVVFLHVTAVGGSGGLALYIRGIDPVGGSTFTLNAAPTAVTTVGFHAYALGAGVSGTGTDFKQGTSCPLPKTFIVTVIPVDASSYTYSVGYSLIL